MDSQKLFSITYNTNVEVAVFSKKRGAQAVDILPHKDCKCSSMTVTYCPRSEVLIVARVMRFPIQYGPQQ